MIISASRRTDIPALYAEWFYNRLKEGFVYVQHPRNPKMFSKVLLNSKVVDCFVFWSKNPKPMFTGLDYLKNYAYYFQFTLTPYKTDIERRLPTVEQRIETFKQVAELIGRNKVIWRYDPILINKKYTIGFHIDAFAHLAYTLRDHTEKCIISFIDLYKYRNKEFEQLQIQSLSTDTIYKLAKSFSKTAIENQINIETCAESIDLSLFQISKGACIDLKQIEKITGHNLQSKKDINQRSACQCIESIDIGTYNTCTNDCIYCYATTSRAKLLENKPKHDPYSPKLIGLPAEADIIIEKKMRILQKDQPFLFENH